MLWPCATNTGGIFRECSGLCRTDVDRRDRLARATQSRCDYVERGCISLISGPLTIDINHDGIKDTVAVFRCNFGGSANTTALWLFDKGKSGFTVLAGPIDGRTGQIQSVVIRGKDLVTSEKFLTALDPQCCPSGTASTTWAWHNKALRIIRPTLIPGTTTVKAAPTDNPWLPPGRPNCPLGLTWPSCARK